MKVRKYFLFLLLTAIFAFPGDLLAAEGPEKNLKGEAEESSEPDTLAELQDAVVEIKTIVRRANGTLATFEGYGIIVDPKIVITVYTVVPIQIGGIPNARIGVTVGDKVIEAWQFAIFSKEGLIALILDEEVMLPPVLKFFYQEEEMGETLKLILPSEVIDLPVPKENREKVENVRGAPVVDENGIFLGAVLKIYKGEKVEFGTVFYHDIEDLIKIVRREQTSPDVI